MACLEVRNKYLVLKLNPLEKLATLRLTSPRVLTKHAKHVGETGRVWSEVLDPERKSPNGLRIQPSNATITTPTEEVKVMDDVVDYFSLNLPVGPNQGSVASLLDHLSRTLRKAEVSSEMIMEIHLTNGASDGSPLPSVSVQLYKAVSIDE